MGVIMYANGNLSIDVVGSHFRPNEPMGVGRVSVQTVAHQHN